MWIEQLHVNQNWLRSLMKCNVRITGVRGFWITRDLRWVEVINISRRGWKQLKLRWFLSSISGREILLVAKAPDNLTSHRHTHWFLTGDWQAPWEFRGAIFFWVLTLSALWQYFPSLSLSFSFSLFFSLEVAAKTALCQILLWL